MREIDVRPAAADHIAPSHDAFEPEDFDGTSAPLQFGAIVIALLAVVFIVANAAFLQSAPHPAPIFQTRADGEIVSGIDSGRKSAERVTQSAADKAEMERIRRFQTLLSERGYDAGTADGVIGTKTRQAIKAFERDQGLPETGTMSTALLSRLLHASPVAKPQRVAAAAVPKPAVKALEPAVKASQPALGDPDREDVLLVQRTLSDLGYGPLDIDGVHGSQTAQAIQRFELDRGLPITGQIGDRILAELVLIGGMKPVARR